MLLNLPEDSEMPLGLLTVASGDAAEFLARHGLGAGLVVRGVFFTRLAAVLGGLPICMAAAILFAALARLARRWRGYPLRGLVLLIACWALAAALLLGLIGAVPPELLPGRWSDFPAWGALFRGWVTGLFELFASAKTRPELRMTAESLRAAWGAVSAALLFAGGRLLLHARSITS